MFFLFISLCLSLGSPFSLFWPSQPVRPLNTRLHETLNRKNHSSVSANTNAAFAARALEIVFLFGVISLNVFPLHRKATSCNIAAETFGRKIFLSSSLHYDEKRRETFYCFPPCIRLAVVKAFLWTRNLAAVWCLKFPLRALKNPLSS